MRILLLNGPNLNMLGTREPHIYGYDTLDDIVGRVVKRGDELGAEVVAEGALIDFIQVEAPASDGMVLNLGALTHTSIGLRDAVSGTGKPAVEVHISNIFAREAFREHSYISGVSKGIISGLGWRGYIYALEWLVAAAKEGS
jgi:3-dehydroquinate dehydratase-2